MRIDVEARLATQAHVAAMNAAIEEHEETAARGLDRIVRRYVRQGVARFTTGRAVTAAAGDFDAPSWRIPIPVDLLDEAAMEAELEARARAYSDDVARTTTTSMAANLGIEFNQSNALLEDVIAAQAGSRITTAPKDLVKVMMGSLQESYDRGHSIPKAARAMRDAGYAHSKSYAVRIARTELIGAVNAASLAQVQGATNLPYKVWMATGDNRTRPTHRAADSQVVPIDSTFVVGSARLEYPGDRNGPGEEVIMCRCTIGYTDEAYPGARPTTPQVASQEWGSAVEWNDDSEAATVMRESLAIASRVHGTGPKPPPRVMFNGKQQRTDPHGEGGAFVPRPGSNSAIYLDVEGNSHAMMDALHEWGHYLDFEVLGSRGTFASHHPSGALRDLMRAINDSRAVRYNIPQVGDTQTRNYLNRSHEKLARAYSQWITEASADPRLLATPAYRRAQERSGASLWRGDDFTAIREAFEALAAEQKWHPVLTTVAGGTTMAAVVETEDTIAVEAGASWSGVIAQEGVDTGDGRRIAEGALNWRELPLTLMTQLSSAHGGLDSGPALVGGRIDSIERSGSDIVASGIFDTGESGAETERLVRDGHLRGISIDLAINDAEIIPPEDPKDEIEMLLGGTLNVLDGTILGATVVPFPAFENASIAIVAGAAMSLHRFRHDDGRAVVSFYMPFAPFPTGDAEDDAPPAADNTDAADAIADITDAVNGHPGLDGKVVITIDGEDTTVNFPAAEADSSDAESATIGPDVQAALARLVTAIGKARR